MDVGLTDVAILLLRVALVLILYAFVAFVVRGAVRTLRSEPSRDLKAATVLPERLRLEVLEPGDSELRTGQLVVVADGATLGRAEEANIVVTDSAVSAEHARLERINGRWMVHDLGSTNGTLVNQALVDKGAALRPGDVLGLGNVRLKVVGRA